MEKIQLFLLLAAKRWFVYNLFEKENVQLWVLFERMLRCVYKWTTLANRTDKAGSTRIIKHGVKYGKAGVFIPNASEAA